MNADLKRAYVGIRDNEVVAFDTNLKDFVDKLTLVEPGIGNYMSFYRKFQKDQKVIKEVDGKVYYLQQVI